MKIILTVLLFSSLLRAVSFGFSVPVGIIDHEDLSYGSFGEESYLYDYQYGTGLGIVLDTNVAQQKTFGYRVALEYTTGHLKSTNREEVTSLKRDKYDIVHTFAFGVVQEPKFKWWVGPRINIQYEKTSGSGVTYQNSWGFGVAAATGVNYKVAKRIALATDIEYHGNIMFGGESYEDDFSVFFGTTSGATVRFYLLFVFEAQPSALSETLDSDDNLY